MTETKQNAIIISLSSDTAEIIQLADSLEYSVVKEFIQQRTMPDVNYYIGTGKLDEIKEFLETSEEKIDLVIVNGELKPSQWFSLEKELKVTIYDRVRLILAIFEKRAERREAKLQVKLAQLQYERPLVHELIHRAKAGEHPGYMAGGEYQVDDYYETIKKQMKKTRDDLEKIRTDREVHRQTRYKEGFYLVSLAGYTNAGKSSLLNLLADEHVHVEGRLFSTLSTTTRRIPKNVKGKTIPILLTDTVGFIENLPAWIIDAFHSTLEEIEVADIVLLIVDGSEPTKTVERKLQVSLTELRELKVAAPVIIVLNKTDLVPSEQIKELISYLTEKKLAQRKTCVPISVKEHKNIDRLLKTIYDVLPNMSQLTLHLPTTKESQKFISQLYDIAHVLSVHYSETITVTLECNAKIKDKLLSTNKDLGGTVL